jgi:hypothetical protein
MDIMLVYWRILGDKELPCSDAPYGAAGTADDRT